MSDQKPRNGLEARRLFLAEGGLIALAVWAYWSALTEVVATWFSDPDYTHGLLVVPIALWLLWARREELPPSSKQIAWSGMCLLALAGLMRYIAGRFYLLQIDAWSIPIWIAGVVWLFHGFRRLVWAAPSIAFLWFATPLPGRVAEAVSLPLQKLAASLSASGLQLLGQPAIVDGTTVLLGEHVLDIERACSGLRIFYGIFALAVACVVILRPKPWKAAVILLTAAPVAISTNLVRIVVSGLLMQHVSSATAARFTHDFAGLVMIPLAAVLFMLLYWFLGQTDRKFADGTARGLTWIIGWMVAFLGISVCCFFAVRQQREKAYGTLLEIAESHERAGDRFQALNYLLRYTTVRPEDNDALIKLAGFINELSHSRGEKLRAIEVYRDALRRLPDHADLAESAVLISLSIGEYRTAIELCREALNNAERAGPSIRDNLIKYQADALVDYIHWEGGRADYDWQDAESALRQAIDDVEIYEIRHALALATSLRNHSSKENAIQRNAEADDLMDKVVRDYPKNPLAWLARYRYRLQIRQEKNAPDTEPLEDLTSAIALADALGEPDRAWQVYVEAARSHRDRGELDDCRRFLTKAISAAPERALAYAMLADMERNVGGEAGLRTAEDVLRQGVSAVTDNQLTLILPLAYVLAEQGKFEAAEKQIEPLEELMPQLVDSQRALVKVATGVVHAQAEASSGDTYSAIHRLAQLVATSDAQSVMHTEPRLLSQSWSLLAELYREVGNLDQALDALQQIGRINGESVEWRAQVAMFALMAGDLESAYSQYRALSADQPALAWLSLANIATRQQLARRRTERDWGEAERALRHARDAGAPNDSCALVEAELLAAQEKFTAAGRVLQAARKENPEDTRLLRGLAVVEKKLGNLDRAIVAAERYLHQSGQSADAIILQATLLEDAGRDNEAISILSDAVQKGNEEAAIALAHFYLRRSESKQAIVVLEDYLRSHPRSPAVIDFLANWAWLSGDWPALEACEQQLAEEIEGNEGTLWRAYRAQRLIAQVRDRSDPRFEDAVSLSQEIIRLRPQWSKTHLIVGELELLRGNIDAAVASYERAWRLGGRGIILTDRLIDLLTRLGRYEEAQDYVEQATAYLAISPQFFDHALPYYARSGERLEALRVAESWVRQRPKDPDAYLRLGRVLSILGEETVKGRESSIYLDRAETAFQTAIRLAPADVQPWVAYVTFYARDDTTRAKTIATLAEFAQQVSIETVQREFVLGQLYEYLEVPVQAEIHYMSALEELPGALAAGQQSDLISRVALFYASRTPWVAERFARRALALNPSNELAERVLLRALALRTDQAALEEAQKMIKLASYAPRDLLDRRACAMILAKTGRPDDLSDAIELLESALQGTADDKLLLARLYEQSDRLGAAYGLLEDLTNRSTVRPGDLAEYLHFWQEHFLVPSDFSQSKFQDRAATIYNKLLSTSGQEGEWLRWKIRERRRLNGGDKISSDEALAIVEMLWQTREVQSLGAEQLESLLLSAMVVLLQEDQSNAALTLARHSPPPLTDNQAIVCLSHALIVTGSDGAPEVTGLTELFDRKKSEASIDVTALVAMGDCQYMTGQYAAAVDSYREVISRDPTHTTARNNLALALAEQENQQALAREVCAQAIREQPDDLAVLDTLAVVEILQGRAIEAIQILDKVATRTPDNPVVHLHRSMAHQLNGRDVAAQEAFVKAMALGLTQRLLSPRDRDFVNKMLRNVSSATERSSSGNLMRIMNTSPRA